MPSERPRESDLIARIVTRDDRRAFADLVRMHEARIRAFLRRVCGDAALADDLAQETFLKCYRGLGRFRAEARFSTWLTRIALNVFRSYARRKAIVVTVNTSDRASEGVAPAPVMLLTDVERAMTALSDDERTAIALCFASELTHPEAADVMGIPLGTLKSHVHRGKEKLRERLGDWNGQ